MTSKHIKLCATHSANPCLQHRLPREVQQGLDSHSIILALDMEVLEGDLRTWLRNAQAPYTYGQPAAHADLLRDTSFGSWVADVRQLCSLALSVRGVVHGAETHCACVQSALTYPNNFMLLTHTFAPQLQRR